METIENKPFEYVWKNNTFGRFLNKIKAVSYDQKQNVEFDEIGVLRLM